MTTATATRLTIARTPLREALVKLATVVATKSTLPIASHVSLVAADGLLTLTATNFEAWAQVALPCDTDGEASLTLPARRLLDVVSNLPPAGPVTLELEATRARITAGRARCDILGLPHEEFPLVPSPSVRPSVTLSAVDFCDAMSRAVAFASDDACRPAINAVSLQSRDGAMIAIAADGHISAFVPLGAGTLAAPLSLHKTDVPLLVRMFSGLSDDDVLSVSADEYRVHVAHGGTFAQVRTVAMAFPDVERLVRTTSRHEVVADRLMLAAALKRVAFAASGKENRVVMAFDSDCTITASDADIGSASDVVTLELHDRKNGAAFRFGANVTYLTLALGALTTPSVRIILETPTKPIHFRNEPADAALVVVMPLHLVD